ncbi:MAG: 2-oxoglutarate dehydrogenase complex dihydrolipoyllysine-residue succinyltransferase [Dongiaceae bacterium]
MTIEIKVPPMGESVSEATVAKWLKQPGEAVKADEALVELETDKVTVEVNAPKAGMLSEIKVPVGGNVKVGGILGMIQEGAAGKTTAPQGAPKAAAPAPAKVAPAAMPTSIQTKPAAAMGIMPAARRLAAESGVDAGSLEGSGKGGRVTKGDVMQSLESPSLRQGSGRQAALREERVKMSKLRQKIAERLKASQEINATLTTFNEIDMSAILALREQYKETFEKKHGVKLGFMSFFVKAAIEGLKEIPAVNAEISGDEIIYKNYYDIGVAVGGGQGLVVPVLRDADQKSFSELEKQIGAYGQKAKEGKITLDELSGGTFTITNGGVYGSLLATPIINPPQSGILGMHKIEKRAVVVNDQVVVRPMMYVALSYDHRIIDGREAVTFLVRVKECIEDPQRLLLGM